MARMLFLLVLGLAVPSSFALAQDAPPPREEQPAKDPAIEFLEKLEEKNTDLKTLHGTFTQVRENTMFSERIESKGEFWHTKPDLFRCDYKDPSPAVFYLVEGIGYFYSPENKQLDKYKLSTGDEAPINELLVGFGIDVDLILDVFSVRLADEQPEDDALIRIEFISRDTERTLDFQRIVITFSREELEPRILFMEESQDNVWIELEKIEKNIEIPPSMYETEFPDDVTVYEY